MRVCGIDPGTISAGYGIIEYDGGKIFHVDNGLITSKASRPLPGRLLEIYEGVKKVLAEFSPAAVALEDVFFAKNARSVLALGYGRAMVMLACEERGIPIHEYQPVVVKKCVTGYGMADKEQMQRMVKALLGLPEVAATDAADALGVAICHAYHIKDGADIGKAAPASRRAKKRGGG